MRRAMTTAIATALLLGCSDGPGVLGPPGFTAVSGTYVLTSVDGIPLPLLISSTGGVQQYLTDDTLSLGLSYNVSQRFRTRTVIGANTTESPGIVAYGYAVPAVNTIVVTQSGVPLTGTGHVLNDQIVINTNAGALYGQHSWNYRCVTAGTCR